LENKLYKHFLRAFLIAVPFVLVPFISVFIDERDTNELTSVVIFILLLLVFATLLGGFISYKFGDRIKLKKDKKLLKKGLFNSFVEKDGFVNHNQFLNGIINGYFISVFNKEDYPQHWIEVQIIFNPKQQNQYIPAYLFQKLKEQSPKEFIWSSNILTIKKIYGISLPSYDSVKLLLVNAIDTLRKNSIESISLQDWMDTVEGSQHHYMQVSRLNA